MFVLLLRVSIGNLHFGDGDFTVASTCDDIRDSDTGQSVGKSVIVPVEYGSYGHPDKREWHCVRVTKTVM